MKDRGTLLKQRDVASDWIKYGAGLAIVIGVLGFLLPPDTINKNSNLAFGRVILYLAIGLVGLLMRPNRLWAGFLLIVLLIASLVLSAVTGTLFTGIIFRVIALGVCVKSVVAMFQYDRLDREIAEFESPDELKKTP